MQDKEDAQFRIRLAKGFLEEAMAHAKQGFWRSVVDNSQLVVENAAKAVVSLYKPLPKIHQLESILKEVIEEFELGSKLKEKIEELTELTLLMGFETHIRTDYGDEIKRLTPWELFTEQDAKEAINLAERALKLAQDVIVERTK